MQQPTFTAACLELGLIHDDEGWKRARHEAEIWMMPRQLRTLFVRILIHCQPIHPQALWEEFKDAMAEDYARHTGPLEGRQKAYKHIKNMLSADGKNLDKFSTMPQLQTITDIDEDTLPSEEATEKGNLQYLKLNNEQKEIVDSILSPVDNIDYRGFTAFYIDGPGGSGKTFIYNTLWYLLKGRKKREYYGFYRNRSFATEWKNRS